MDKITEITLSDWFIATVKWLETRGFHTLFILLIAWSSYHLVNYIVERMVKKVIHRGRYGKMTEVDIQKRQTTLIGLIATLFRLIIVVATTMFVIKSLFPNVSYAPIFASAGIIGVALGFGAQSLVKDFITGVFIITENQYRVGDIVDIEGAAGTVEHVGIRSTVIRDVEGNVHYLPNGMIAHVINKTMGFSKVNFTISVKPDTDVDRLTDIINETGEKLAADTKWKDKVTEAPHFVNISGFTRLGMDVLVSGTTTPADQWGVTGELRRRLLVAFNKHKIELASPPSMLGGAGKKK